LHKAILTALPLVLDGGGIACCNPVDRGSPNGWSRDKILGLRGWCRGRCYRRVHQIDRVEGGIVIVEELVRSHPVKGQQVMRS